MRQLSVLFANSPCMFISVYEIISLQFFFKLGFTPCKAEQSIGGIELQEKEAQKD